jgi:hypothetical protein
MEWSADGHGWPPQCPLERSHATIELDGVVTVIFARSRELNDKTLIRTSRKTLNVQMLLLAWTGGPISESCAAVNYFEHGTASD